MKSFYRRVFVVFSLLVISLSVQGQSKHYQGRLWKITGNGLDKPSYLYGTMHVSGKVSFHLSDSFFIGLKNSNIVALESDPSTWMGHFFKRTRKASTSSWGSFSSGVGFYNRAFSISFPEKKNLKWMFRSENRLTNGMLYRSSEYGAEYEEDTYLDLFIYQAGTKLGKGIAALENYDTVRRLEKLANKPSKQDIKNRKKFKRRYGLWEKIEDAYRDGDLDLLDSLNKLGNPTSKYHHYFIDERNRRMVIKMDSIMKSGKTVFAGVGAAHLPGDVGMIKLFRELGYSVNSVEHHEGKIAMKTKAQIEKLKSPVKYSKYTSTDGAFSVNVPGKLYEMYYNNSINYYYPDMGNGGYYQVVRSKHFMNLQGLDQAYILRQLDSLFFENIPGKILTKEKIVVDNIPGYDIVNVTKKGEYQRHTIFVSPLEIFYFKAHANGNYLKKESDKFINSIHFFPTEPTNNQGYTFKPPYGEFSLVFPAIPYYSKDSTAIESTNKNLNLQCFDPVAKSYYLFMKANLNDYSFIEEDSFELGRLAEEVMKDTKFDSILSYQQKVGTHSSLLVHSANEDNKEAWMYFTTVGGNYYLLLTDASESDASKYFQSFKRESFTYNRPMREYQDTNMYFKVNINYHLEPEDEFDNPYEYYRYYGMDEDKLDQGHSSKSSYLTLKSPESGESVSIRYYKYYKYYTAFDTSYWKKSKEYYQDFNNDMTLHFNLIKIDTSGEVKTLEYIITDTGSTKAIVVKEVIKGGVYYELNTLIDSVYGMSPFIKEIYNTFEPLDTFIGRDIFEDKKPLFISDLYSKDTVEQQHAEQCLNRVKYDSTMIDTMMHAFNTIKFHKKQKSRKAEILEGLHSVKSEEVIGFLEKVYRNSVDTFAYQVAVLRSLGNMEMKESYLALKELILEEAPLSESSYKINEIFYPLNDSLELTRLLYPDLLELSSYPEYKEDIYELLVDMLDSGDIKPSDYAAQVRIITREAKDELKRQFASEGSTSSYYSYSYEDDESYSTLLDYYIRVLIPYYKKDERVKEFYRRLLRSENKRLKMATTLAMYKEDIEVNDTFWTFFSKEPKLKMDFYKLLVEQEDTHLFVREYGGQKAFAKTMIMNEYNSFDVKKDSMKFVSRKFMLMDDTSGYVYFFKVKTENDADWSLAYAGLFSPDTSIWVVDTDISKKGIELDIREDIEKLMKKKLKGYRWRDRKRVSSGNEYNWWDSF